MKNDSPYHSLTSYDSHTKRFVIIAVVIVAAVAVVYYFIQPGHGDSVGTPPDLAYAVREHFKENEKRAVQEVRTFHCDSFDNAGQVVNSPDYVVETTLEVRRARVNEDEQTRRWAVLAKAKGNRAWDLTAIQLPPEPGDKGPCVR